MLQYTEQARRSLRTNLAGLIVEIYRIKEAQVLEAF